MSDFWAKTVMYPQIPNIALFKNHKDIICLAGRSKLYLFLQVYDTLVCIMKILLYQILVVPIKLNLPGLVNLLLKIADNGIIQMIVYLKEGGKLWVGFLRS